MSSYRSIYAKLFQLQSKVIQLLQKLQQETEDMFIEAEEPDSRLLSDFKSNDDSKSPDKKNKYIVW